MGEYDLKVIGETNSGSIIGLSTIPVAKLSAANLRVLSRKVSEVQITWDAPEGEIRHYEVLSKSTNSAPRVETSLEEKFTFQFLEPDTKYTFSVVCIDRNGNRGKPTEILVQTLPLPQV